MFVSYNIFTSVLVLLSLDVHSLRTSITTSPFYLHFITFQFIFVSATPALALISLAPGDECRRNAFGSVCLFVCPDANSKTIAPVDLMFYTGSMMPVARFSKIQKCSSPLGDTTKVCTGIVII